MTTPGQLGCFSECSQQYVCKEGVSYWINIEFKLHIVAYLELHCILRVLTSNVFFNVLHYIIFKHFLQLPFGVGILTLCTAFRRILAALFVGFHGFTQSPSKFQAGL